MFKPKSNVKAQFVLNLVKVEKTDAKAGSKLYIQWKRGAKKENKGKTALAVVRDDGALVLGTTINLVSTLVVTPSTSVTEGTKYESKFVAFSLKDEKDKSLGKSIIDLADFAADKKPRELQLSLKKGKPPTLILNLFCEIIRIDDKKVVTLTDGAQDLVTATDLSLSDGTDDGGIEDSEMDQSESESISKKERRKSFLGFGKKREESVKEEKDKDKSRSLRREESVREKHASPSKSDAMPESSSSSSLKRQNSTYEASKEKQKDKDKEKQKLKDKTKKAKADDAEETVSASHLSQIESFKARESELLEKLDKLEKQVADFDQVRSQLAETEKANTKLSTALKAAEDHLSGIESSHRKQSDEIDQFRGRISELERDLAKEETERSSMVLINTQEKEELSKHNSNLKADLDHFQARLAEVNQELSSAKAQAVESESRSSSYQIRIASLEQELANQRQSFSLEIEVSKEQLSRDQAQHLEQIAALQQALEKTRLDASNLQEKHSAVLNELEATKITLSEEKNSFDSRLNELSNELASSIKRFQDLQEQTADQDRKQADEISEAQTRVSSLQQLVDKLSSQLESANNNLEIRSSVLQEKEALVAEQERHIAKVTQALAIAQSDLDVSAKRLADIDNELQQSKIETQKLSAALAQANGSNLAAQESARQLEVAHNSLSSKQTQIDMLVNQMDELKQVLEVKKTQITELTTASQAANSERDSLRDTLVRVTVELEEAREQKQAIATQSALLENELRELRAQLEVSGNERQILMDALETEKTEKETISAESVEAEEKLRNSLTAERAEMQVLASKLAEAEERCRLLALDHEEGASKLSSTDALAADLQNQVIQLTADLEKAAAAARSAESRVSLLEKQLENAAAEESRLKGSLEQLLEEGNQHDRLRSELAESLEAEKRNAQNLREQLTLLESARSHAEVELAREKAKGDALLQQLESLKSATEDLAKERLSNLALQEELLSLRRQLSDVRTSTSSSSEQLEELLAKTAQLQKLLDEAQESQLSSSHKMDDLLNQNQLISAENLSLRAQSDTLEAQRSAIEQSANEQKALVADLLDKTKTLEAQLEFQVSERRRETAENNQNRELLQRERDSLEKGLSTLAAELAAARAGTQASYADLEVELRSQLSAFKEELDNERRSRSTLEEELQVALLSVSAKANEMEQVKFANETLSERIKQMEASLSNTALDSVSAQEHKAIVAQKSALEIELEQEQRRSKELRHVIETLEHQLTDIAAASQVERERALEVLQQELEKLRKELDDSKLETIALQCALEKQAAVEADLRKNVSLENYDIQADLQEALEKVADLQKSLKQEKQDADSLRSQLTALREQFDSAALQLLNLDRAKIELDERVALYQKESELRSVSSASAAALQTEDLEQQLLLERRQHQTDLNLLRVVEDEMKQIAAELQSARDGLSVATEENNKLRLELKSVKETEMSLLARLEQQQTKLDATQEATSDCAVIWSLVEPLLAVSRLSSADTLEPHLRAFVDAVTALDDKIIVQDNSDSSSDSSSGQESDEATERDAIGEIYADALQHAMSALEHRSTSSRSAQDLAAWLGQVTLIRDRLVTYFFEGKYPLSKKIGLRTSKASADPLGETPAGGAAFLLKRIESLQMTLLRSLLSIYRSKIETKLVPMIVEPQKRNVKHVLRAIGSICRELEQMRLPSLIIDQIVTNVYSRFNAAILNTLTTPGNFELCRSTHAIELRLAISLLDDWITQHRPQIIEKTRDCLRQADEAVAVMLLPDKSLVVDPDVREQVVPDLLPSQIFALVNQSIKCGETLDSPVFDDLRRQAADEGGNGILGLDRIVF